METYRPQIGVRMGRTCGLQIPFTPLLGVFVGKYCWDAGNACPGSYVMKMRPRLAILVTSAISLASWSVAAELPPPEKALKGYVPIQGSVEIDNPDAEEAARCKIYTEKVGGTTAIIIDSPDGLRLRSFTDTNGDKYVDQWAYFKDGVEVYRDIDGNGNKAADQYRWFHTGGSRWGLDNDEDGKIDAWKSISAEEVTAEIVAALATRDSKRFLRVALSPTELKALGLGEEKTAALAKLIEGLEQRFTQLAANQKAVAPGTKWMQFSGSRPGVVPSGTDGSKKDLHVYENVVAITETDGKHGQVQIGTLIKVGDGWRAVALPVPAEEGQQEIAAVGLFFNKPPNIPQPDVPTSVPSDALQKAMAKLQELDAAAASATEPTARAEYHAKRADLFEEIVKLSPTAKEKGEWARQCADMVSYAVQFGEYPDGAARLDKLLSQAKAGGDDTLVAYITFRKITAEYVPKMQSAGANDFGKVRQEWLDALEKFAESFPKSPDAAEAMLQLGMDHEISGEEDKAKQWYDRIVKEFADTSQAQKAGGAQRRLDSVGNVIRFEGKDEAGKTIDLDSYRGKVVLIQYWASWCEPCKAHMTILKALSTSHDDSKFQVLGVNVDSSLQDMKSFLAQNPLPWQQIHEDGGLDSRPANELGIHTVPTMLLIDQQGRVVNRNVQVAELDTELNKLIR